MPISIPRPISDSSKNISTPIKPGQKVEKKVDPWGAYQKMPTKNIFRRAEDRDIRSKTGMSELQGKQILKKTFGSSDYAQKRVFQKTIKGLETKSRHAPTGKERTEASKELKYLRHIEKSLE